MPDQDYSFMPDGGGQSNWHYLDAHSYDPLSYSGGQLPWAMEWIFDNIVQYLKDKNWDTAAQLMGAICHFAGDASCPFHATYDFNPGGIGHSAYEGAVNSHIGEMSIPTNYVPQYLDDITNAALVTLAGSFDFTDEDPNGGVNIGGGTSWNDTIKSISENRVRAGVQFTANVWYTAMVQAGMMGPTSSVNAMTSYWQTSVPFTITATASGSVQSVSLYYRYSTDNSSWGGWTFFEDDLSPSLWSFTAPQGDGYYEFYSIARDSGNEEPSPDVADARCGVDTLAPASSVDTISPYWGRSIPYRITATVSDTFSGVGNVSLYYRHSTDNPSWGGWVFYKTDTLAPWSWTITEPFDSGYYEFYSISQDKATNAESAPIEADARCGVDTAAPSAPAKSSPADGTITNNNRPTFTWAAATDDLRGIARYELWVDDDPDFSSPEVLENTVDDVTLSLTSPVLAEGNYSWRVRAWDRAGNNSDFETLWALSVVTISMNVEVAISPGENSAGPREDVAFTVTVTNTGNVANNYDLKVGDDTGWGATLSENLLTIPAGESRAVVVGVTVPSDAVEGDSTMILITAASQADPMVETSASCTAYCVKNVASVTSLTISPSGFALYPGYSGQVQSLTVTLRAGNNPLPNKTITWSVASGSVNPSSGTTDAVGQVSVVYTAPKVTAETSQVTITASFAGDTQYQASSGTSLGIPAIPVSENISASNGGTVVINVIEINVTVNILVVPPNALSENTAITVVQAPLENLPGYKMVSRVFDVGPSGTTFTTPSTLTLPYDENELPAGVSEDNLAIYYYNTDTNSWERVGGIVNKVDKTVSVQIDHLSKYAVMVSISEGGVGGGELLLLTIGIIIAVVSIIAVIALLLRRR